MTKRRKSFEKKPVKIYTVPSLDKCVRNGQRSPESIGVKSPSLSTKSVVLHMGGDSGGERGTCPPIIGVGDVNGIVPPKFVVFVSTLNSEEYSSIRQRNQQTMIS